MKKFLISPIFVLSLLCSCEDSVKVPEKNFPMSIQFSPVPSGEGWHGEEGPVSDEVKKATVRNLIEHGMTHISVCPGADSGIELDYAESLGMKIDYRSHGVELFHRDFPPENCVFTRQYLDSMRTRIEPQLGNVRKFSNPYSIIPFMDEPFHRDTTSFDFSEAAQKVFKEKYGYPMPASFDEARKDPLLYMDFINFQSSTFSYAWKKIYDEVKKLDDRPLVTITHDSHNTMGGGAHSDSAWAVDDIFHWGADFADMFIYDIYPYLHIDYRTGEGGLVCRPRMSQLHWTLAQMRNLTVTYGKKMGFWVGVFNGGSVFADEKVRGQYWMEREVAYTAIAGGSDYLLTFINAPSDARHWDDFGEAMTTVQKVGGSLLETERPRAKACFLFPRTQHVLLNQEYFNVAMTYELCLRTFGEMDVIHEDQIVDDDLLGFKILFLADVEILPEAVAERIRDFVKKGGIVIADCVPQTDEALKESATLMDVFGVSSSENYRVKQEGQWVSYTKQEPFWMFMDKEWKEPEKTFDDADGFRVVSPRHCVAKNAATEAVMKSGEPLLLSNEYGKGRTYLFGFCLQDTYFETFKNEDTKGREELQDLVRSVFLSTGAESSTYSSNPDVEVALRTGPGEAFALVINHEAEDAHATLKLSNIGFEVRKVVDVRTGEKLSFSKDGNGITLDVCPQEGSEGGMTRLLKLCRK